ncbi:hypothetical protein BGZ96_007931 [Linnemannia gamsii]|uniref:Uncharacterized protein n=1 Tax=Linnemannia gamsii TaxID=64522 RepID=A0ABQ7JZT7_9FUNG|nr:hypothetical protein BGZ96_007931 [Linnemannia gamsii]
MLTDARYFELSIKLTANSQITAAIEYALFEIVNALGTDLEAVLCEDHGIRIDQAIMRSLRSNDKLAARHDCSSLMFIGILATIIGQALRTDNHGAALDYAIISKLIVLLEYSHLALTKLRFLVRKLCIGYFVCRHLDLALQTDQTTLRLAFIQHVMHLLRMDCKHARVMGKGVRTMDASRGRRLGGFFRSYTNEASSVVV